MKAEVGRPDPRPPGFQRLGYAAFCWTTRHPGAWRLLGNLLRRIPRFNLPVPFVARRDSVRKVLTRTRSFSNTSHAPNLIASDFLIGMDPGPTYDADRALFESFLGMLSPKAHANFEAQKRASDLARRGPGADFDLIEDYLLWVVFAAIKPAFGAAADYVVAGSRDDVPDEVVQRHYLHEVRYVAAHLLAGRLAPIAVKRRAEVCAAALRARIVTMTPELCLAWPQSSSTAYSAIQRNAIGLAWVSHPVTVQSAAQVVQELLGRPKVYDELRKMAAELGPAAWTCGKFRQTITDHVLELMRFRPVFPVLARDVPRAAELATGARNNLKCPAGSGVGVLGISALFDPHGMEDINAYCPSRDWKSDGDIRFLMFGLGDRQCPAKDHAVEILTSALIGVLTLPRLGWTDRWGSRIGYDGPLINRMRLRLAYA